MRISSWRMRGVIGALSLIVLGAFLGMVTDRIVFAHVGDFEPVDEGSTIAVASVTHRSAMVSFRQVLQLDDDQIEAIHEILMQHQALVNEAWEHTRAQLQTEIDSVHEEIRVLLSPEQQDLFARWIERHGDPAMRGPH